MASKCNARNTYAPLKFGRLREVLVYDLVDNLPGQILPLAYVTRLSAPDCIEEVGERLQPSRNRHGVKQRSLQCWDQESMLKQSIQVGSTFVYI